MKAINFLGTLFGLGLLFGGINAVAGNGHFSSSGDLIGTLPVVYPDTPDKGVTGGYALDGGTGRFNTDSPCFLLTGLKGDLESSIQTAYGTGFVSVTQTQTPGIIEYAFYGDIIVEVDRDMLEQQQLDTRLRVGTTYLGGVGLVEWTGFSGDPITLGYEIGMPYGELLEAGVADQDTVEFNLFQKSVPSSYVNLTVNGSAAQIEQTTH